MRPPAGAGTACSSRRGMFMPRIRKLPEHLVNMIAAGEVVERPASVLKELLENSIDAGASRIEVTIRDGGKKLIQVSDDGKGMGKDDASLAFASHATSKLAKETDLFDIRTLGFRGEALASIARISKARIRSRPGNDPSGWEVTAAGEKCAPPRPCPIAPGTTVSVEELFFNVPARRKFLKKTATEFGHITEQLIRVAIPHPDVAFLLRHNARETMMLPPADTTVARIANIFSEDLAASLVSLQSRQGRGITVDGLIAPLTAARSTAKWQYVFLNGRYIRDRLIGHAAREAFRGRIDPRKYPVCFLFIRVDPEQVDVNVHPTKTEVRFRDANAVYGEVLASLKETLQSLESDSSDNFSPGIAATAARAGDDGTGRADSMRQAIVDFFKTAPSPQPQLDFTALPRGDAGTCSDIKKSGRGGSPVSETRPVYRNTGRPDRAGEPHNAVNDVCAGDYAQTGIMQIHNTYIVVETCDGIEIVDQHALHERVLYNRLKNKLLAEPLASQAALIPRHITVTPREMAIINDNRTLFDRLGMEIVAFGPDSVAIQQFPVLLVGRTVDPVAFLRDMLDRFSDDMPASEEEMVESVLSAMACAAAVKAGDRLSADEMRELVGQATRQDKALSCPHGRPTRIVMSLADLEKCFGRSS